MRLSFLLAVAGLSNAGGLMAFQPPAMFRGGPAHTGVIETVGLETLGGVAWTFEAEGPVRSTPALADGTLYFGSSDGHLYAVDARDGRERWRYATGSPVTSSPAVSAGLVIFIDRANTVYAVDAEEGRLVWSLPTGEDRPLVWGHEGWDYVGASALIVPAPAGSEDPADGEGPTGAAVELAVIGSGTGVLYALEAATGRIRWEARTGGRIRGTPAASGSTVYAGSGDGVVYALDLATGDIRWTFETAGVELDAADFGFDRTQIQASPAVADGVVYIGSRDASLYALDAETGDVLWHREDGSAWVVSSAAVRGDAIFSGRSSSGSFRGIDAATGEERWVVSTGGPVFSSPALAGDLVYVGSGSGWLYALETADGAIRWRYRADGGIYSSPIVANGRLYFGSDAGRLYALEAGDGPSPRLGVFWDDDLQTQSAWGGQDAHRTATSYFEGRGYETLDAAGLLDFLRDRIEDGAPSVVVFGMDAVPEGLADGPADGTLLRRYLASGGKVVWLGYPPLLISRDESGAVTGIDRDLPGDLLGIDLSAWDSDIYGAVPTPAGRAWGLDGWAVASPIAEPGAVDVALALDELGRATAFVETYGGPPGTGFVFLPASTSTDRLDEIRRVAEVGVMRRPPNDVP